MGDHVIPYISSLETIEKTAQRLKGETSQVNVHSISHYSPVKTSVSGIAQALNILEEKITPWKREHAKKIAQLKEEEMKVKNEKARVEALEIEARVQKENGIAAINMQEARIAKIKADQLELELEKERFKFRENQAQLAISILRKLSNTNSQMSEASRIAHINEIMGSIRFLIESPIDAKVNKNYQFSER